MIRTIIFDVVILTMVTINLVTFVLYAMDKIKAVNNSWRISEKTLLRLSLAGPLGAYLGMKFFRHKVKKPKFYVGVPFFLIVQLLVILIYLLITK